MYNNSFYWNPQSSYNEGQGNTHASSSFKYAILSSFGDIVWWVRRRSEKYGTKIYLSCWWFVVTNLERNHCKYQAKIYWHCLHGLIYLHVVIPKLDQNFSSPTPQAEMNTFDRHLYACPYHQKLYHEQYFTSFVS